jgi:hypothetical protein
VELAQCSGDTCHSANPKSHHSGLARCLVRTPRLADTFYDVDHAIGFERPADNQACIRPLRQLDVRQKHLVRLPRQYVGLKNDELKVNEVTCQRAERQHQRALTGHASNLERTVIDAQSVGQALLACDVFLIGGRWRAGVPYDARVMQWGFACLG